MKVCPKCGKKYDNSWGVCLSCGTPLKETEGVAVGDIPVKKKPKDSSAAILLAVLLGFWTWVYTYEKDAKKFWLNLILTIVTLGLWTPVSWIWAIVEVVFVREESFYENYYA